MDNDCTHLYKGCLCWLTAHHHDRELIVYHCAYQQNCQLCRDYKPKKKE